MFFFGNECSSPVTIALRKSFGFVSTLKRLCKRSRIEERSTTGRQEETDRAALPAVPRTTMQPLTKLQKEGAVGTSSIRGAQSRDVGYILSSEEFTFVSTSATTGLQACTEITVLFFLCESRGRDAFLGFAFVVYRLRRRRLGGISVNAWKVRSGRIYWSVLSEICVTGGVLHPIQATRRIAEE